VFNKEVAHACVTWDVQVMQGGCRDSGAGPGTNSQGGHRRVAGGL
jgi:hypothetical protein